MPILPHPSELFPYRSLSSQAPLPIIHRVSYRLKIPVSCGFVALQDVFRPTSYRLVLGIETTNKHQGSRQSVPVREPWCFLCLCRLMLCALSVLPCQCLADGIRSLRQRFRKHMGIDIFRCPGITVAEMLGDHFRGYAHVYQE